MADDLDNIWKALSDPTRRTILDLLRRGSKTTTDIVDAFPDMTRFGVMKHLDVLREADLVTTRAEGRRRVNSLNAVPIRQIYERWVSPFAELWSSTLLRLKDDIETKNTKRNRRLKKNASTSKTEHDRDRSNKRNGPRGRDHKSAL
ncbi:MAG TPA: metalloregulator ArsR/SmtB family transcription factor [Pyrinomonadaceae bacterium]|jgi:DNA-binding transcriptional ArsR family regulator